MRTLLETPELVRAYNKANMSNMRLGDVVEHSSCPACFTRHDPNTDDSVNCYRNNPPKASKATLVDMLPGIKMTPDMILSRMLSRAQRGEITSVVISVEWEDKTFNVAWSAQSAETTLCHAKVVDTAATDTFFGVDDNIEQLPPGAG